MIPFDIRTKGAALDYLARLVNALILRPLSCHCDEEDE